ncbi:MAG: VCBS repeat-containing protein [Verrucomicrobiae bacterium]|nr:VCBS repeat-containing protein [Verrucomicrobiae bacterium]
MSPAPGPDGFRRLDALELGIAFTNRVSRERTVLNRNLLNGSGVAAGDIDGDGLCDLYFCGLESDNVLYRNLGDGRFEDITASAGVACAGQDSTGAVFADVNGNGHLDLLVAALDRGVRLFLNDGRGRFREATATSGLLDRPGATSLALADADGDGDLDLYVAHYRPDTIADQPSTRYRLQIVEGWPEVVEVNGQPVSHPRWADRFTVSPLGQIIEHGLPDAFYLNDGTGVFTHVPFTEGAFLDEDGVPLREPPRDWGLAVQFRDFNGDGAPDLYICNDFVSPDRFWINVGSGRFQALPARAMPTISASSMGVDGADLDRNGHIDLFVADMLSPDHRNRHVQLGERAAIRPAPPAGLVVDRLQVPRNTLQWNRGDGTFAEIAQFAGIEASDWSWQPVFLDVDLDGFEDLLIGNGVLRDFQNADWADRMEAARAGRSMSQREILAWIARFPALETPNLAFRNRGDLTFEDRSADWGFNTAGISQGFALADLDNDGDLDLVLNNFLEGPGLYRNVGARPRIAVRLRGLAPNTAGIGARIVVRGGPVGQSQEMISGGRYLSGDQAQRTFAAGTNGHPLEVEVQWRSGRRSVVTAPPNTLLEIHEPDGPTDRPVPAAPSVTAPAAARPWFVEFNALPEVPHAEPPFDEAHRQPLILRRLDRLGPGVTWHDLDRDGWDDLVIANGAGHLPIVLRNLGGTRFERVVDPPFHRPLLCDQTTVLGVGSLLLAGASNYRDGSTNAGLVRLYDFERRAAGDNFPGHTFACGPLALADIDGDGDLDLFVGGRAIPGRYPHPPESILYRNDQGRFTPVQRWEGLANISAALFTDLDGDGFPELVLAADASPLRVFQRRDGQFEEVTDDWGFGNHRGWWAGVASGDLNGDGQLELVASNWGLNTAFRASPDRPRRLYYGDFDGNGTIDLLEARFDPVVGREVPDLTLNWARNALPSLQQRFPTYASYAGAGIGEILGDAAARAGVLEVTHLESTVFRRRGGRFVAEPLPAQAQWAPAFGVTIADVTGNGFEDVFLAQNTSALAPSETPADAGLGLLLVNDGRGGLDPVSARESGIRIEGDQRGAAVADFDGDGRLDLAVGRNRDTVRLFRNVAATPGLRVRLRGPAGNPDGIGAQIRLQAGTRRGAVREVQAGSGFHSQNSAVQVLALPDGTPPDAIWIRWPGGRIAESPIPPAAVEIAVRFDGGLEVTRSSNPSPPVSRRP